MRIRMAACVAAAGMVALMQPALASIIEFKFSGLAYGWSGLQAEIDPNHHNFFSDQPFTADFIFDTDLGVRTLEPEGNVLNGGLISAFIDLGVLGRWGGDERFFLAGSGAGGPSSVYWTDDLSFVNAIAGANYYKLQTSTRPDGSFDFGTFCPDGPRPCGEITSASLISATLPAPVPTPIAGGGLPMMLLLLSLWLYAGRNTRRGAILTH